MNNACVRLRAMEPEDLDMLYRIENDSELWKIGTTNVPYSRYVLHDYIANCANDIYIDRQVRQIIVNSDDIAVGMIDIVNFNPQHNRAEVGIVLQSQYCHQGYAHQALQLLLQYAKVTLHLHQLYALVDIRNTDSLSLFKNTGFTNHLVLKDWLYDGNSYRDSMLLQLFL